MLSQPTASEALLWDQALSRRQLGVTFRRQVPLLGRFIADFYAASCRLVVEVDGAWHGRRAGADARRDRAMTRAGYTVFRLPAELVEQDLPAAVALIRVAITEARRA